MTIHVSASMLLAFGFAVGFLFGALATGFLIFMKLKQMATKLAILGEIAYVKSRRLLDVLVSLLMIDTGCAPFRDQARTQPVADTGTQTKNRAVGFRPVNTQEDRDGR